MGMSREACPNALNAQLFNSQVGVFFISVGVYFLFKIKWEWVGAFRGFFPKAIPSNNSQYRIQKKKFMRGKDISIF